MELDPKANVPPNVKLVSVPNEVILGCDAVNMVPVRFPVTLPVTLPVRFDVTFANVKLDDVAIDCGKDKVIEPAPFVITT